MINILDIISNFFYLKFSADFYQTFLIKSLQKKFDHAPNVITSLF